MKRKKILTYNFALSNKYFKENILCLEHKMLNEKIDVLFDFFILQNKN